MSKEFIPDNIIYYKLGNVIKYEIPKGYSVYQYLYDESKSGYYGVLKKNKSYVIIFLLVIDILLILSLFIIKLGGTKDIDLYIPDKTMAYENKLALNIVNNSNYDITYDVIMNDNIIATGVVQSYSSIGTIDCDYSFQSTDRFVEVELFYFENYKVFKSKYSVLLVNNFK